MTVPLADLLLVPPSARTTKLDFENGTVSEAVNAPDESVWSRFASVPSTLKTTSSLAPNWEPRTRTFRESGPTAEVSSIAALPGCVAPSVLALVCAC